MELILSTIKQVGIEKEKQVDRKAWLDLIKGICMILIILCHTGAPEWYMRFLYPVFLTAFFFSSGYTFSLKKSFKEFLFIKIRTLVIPMLLLGLINTILAFIAEGDNILERICGLLFHTKGLPNDMWFIACLFCCQFIMYAMLRISLRFKKNNMVMFLLSILLLIVGYTLNDLGISLPWYFVQALYYSFYMVVGFLYRTFKDRVEKFEKLPMLILWVVLYTLSIIITDNYPDTNHALFTISSVFGIELMIITCKRIKLCEPIQFIGMNTLVYYAFQSKVIKACQFVVKFLGLNKSPYISTIIITLATCCIIVIPAYIIKRLFPFILGKRDWGIFWRLHKV